MYDFFIKNFGNYIIEDSKEHLIYLITGDKLASQFDWYGERRAEAFNVFKTNPLKNDIEEKDFFYFHMIIWNKETNELAGGQRFLFNQKGFSKNKNHSYIEEYHPGTYEQLKDLSFCEIGRTFVMPRFQNKTVLRELIRGFVRIPESRGMDLGIGLISFNDKFLNNNSVNAFLKFLENTKTNNLKLPEGKYNLNDQLDDFNIEFNYGFEYNSLNKIEKEIKKLDSNFKLPPVLKPYVKFCGLKYETYSIARDYNGIIQILLSGRYNEIEKYPMKKFKNFEFL